MATVVSISKGQMRSHVKGASEIVLGMCSHHLNLKGESVPLTDADKKKYEALIQNMAEGALRTICLAYRDASGGPPAFFFLLLGSFFTSRNISNNNSKKLQ